MLLSDVSVKRPVFAAVISLMLIIFGIVAFDRLPLREYPDVDPPIVTINVNYPGAPANIIESRITKILEERIAGVEGIAFIESRSRDGRSQITIEFDIDQDISDRANDIRDRIATAADDLPEDADAAEIQRANGDEEVIIWQNLTSDRLNTTELRDYAERNLSDRFSVISGVARVRISGSSRYALRVWLDHRALTARQLSMSDVEAALRSENIELPAGSLESTTRQFQARISRQFQSVEQFNQLVIGRDSNNQYLVRLGDIARVELSAEESRTLFRGNGVPMVGVGIIKQSTANTIDVARRVKALTTQLNKNLPDGMIIEDSYDSSIFIERAINEVYKTLGLAILFVIIIIYLFLGNWRAMLIPAITVPVSLIATFTVLYILGFSINMLTLLSMVLAIGLVVDDSIVMLENISRRMEEDAETPLVASYLGARQVAFAVIATTLVLVAVFIPITFLEGDIGRLFTEFAITMAVAVGFSSLVALTLTPMLASKILKSRAHTAQNKRTLSLRIKSGYRRALTFTIAHPSLAMIAMTALLASIVYLYPKLPQEFTPAEDRGAFLVMVNGPEGATFNYMTRYMDEIERRLMPYVDNGEIDRLLVRAPRGFGAIENFNDGMLIVLLHDWSQRRPINTIVSEVRRSLSDLPGVRAFPIIRRGLGGGSNQKPVQFVLTGPTYEALESWRDTLIEKINANNPGLTGLDSDYKANRPQIDIGINYDRAASLGVNINDMGRTLEVLMGGRRVTTFLDRGEEYDIILEGEPEQLRSFEDVNSVTVRSNTTGQLIPMANLITIDEYAAPDTLARYNRARAITIEASLADGYRLGDALDFLRDQVREHLPDEAGIDYKGQSRDYVSSGSDIGFVFLLGVGIVFLVLAAQFESFVHPFVIMLTVPLAIAGGLFGLWLTGASLNIYSQIGLIILVGMSAKNGILIVEFANQLRDRGVAFSDALIEASSARFRPIVMTGLTTLAGAIPLVISSGAGAETRFVIGVVTLAGMSIATLFTLFIVPVAYSLLARKTKSPNAVSRQLEQQQKT